MPINGPSSQDPHRLLERRQTVLRVVAFGFLSRFRVRHAGSSVVAVTSNSLLFRVISSGSKQANRRSCLLSFAPDSLEDMALALAE